MDLANDQRQLLRHEALKFFALRPTAAFSVEQTASLMRYRQSVDFAFAARDLEAALRFLADAGFVKSFFDSLGAAEYFQITSDGTLQFERGGRHGRPEE